MSLFHARITTRHKKETKKLQNITNLNTHKAQQQNIQELKTLAARSHVPLTRTYRRRRKLIKPWPVSTVRCTHGNKLCGNFTYISLTRRMAVKCDVPALLLPERALWREKWNIIWTRITCKSVKYRWARREPNSLRTRDFMHGHKKITQGNNQCKPYVQTFHMTPESEFTLNNFARI